MRSTFRFLLIQVIVCILIAGGAFGDSQDPIVENVVAPDGAQETTSRLSFEEMKALNIKQLRSFLKDRGLECKGCSEKEDFVKMAFDNQDAPKVEPSPQKQPPEEEKLDKEQLDELMAKLRMNGFGNSKMFSADDLKGLSPEELQEKFNGGGAPKFNKPKSKGSKKSDSEKSKDDNKDNSEKKSKKKGDSSKKKQDTKEETKGDKSSKADAKKDKNSSKSKKSNTKSSKPKDSKRSTSKSSSSPSAEEDIEVVEL